MFEFKYIESGLFSRSISYSLHCPLQTKIVPVTVYTRKLYILMRTKANSSFQHKTQFFNYLSPILLTHNSIITLPLKALFSVHYHHHISILSFLLLLRFASQIRTCYIIAQVNLSNWLNHLNIAHDFFFIEILPHFIYNIKT